MRLAMFSGQALRVLFVLVASYMTFDFAPGALAQDTEPQNIESLRAKADSGNAEAQFQLGSLYDHGRGVAEDYIEAAKWYRRAAEQGYLEAQYFLGLMYYRGQGVAQNFIEAAEWFRRAGVRGYVHAQYDLGLMFDKGDGVEQDDAEAAKWYRRAADQGHAEAQFRLGIKYLSATSTFKDYVQAYMWLDVSASNGYQHGARFREICAKNMTSEQVAEAQRISSRFRPKLENPESDPILSGMMETNHD